MNSLKTIGILNSLIVLNNDRIAGYETASKEIQEDNLKTLFSEFQRTSLLCKKELSEEVIRLGGKPEEGTRIEGKFFRVWMDVKAALTGKNKHQILESCEYGEDAALKAYKEVLIQEYHETNNEEQNMLNKHYGQLKADHDKVKHLRDGVVVGEVLLQEKY
jgi:uncharacterized protein (TIGR02284 family)